MKLVYLWINRVLKSLKWFFTILYTGIGIYDFFSNDSLILFILFILTALATCPCNNYFENKEEIDNNIILIENKEIEISQDITANIVENKSALYKNKSLFSPYDDFVYVISNDIFESGVFKIGLTSKSPKERIKQLSSVTGIPQPFEIDILISTNNAKKLEKELHTYFKKMRVSNNREFFKLIEEDIQWIIEYYNVVSINFEHLKVKHGIDLNKRDN